MKIDDLKPLFVNQETPAAGESRAKARTRPAEAETDRGEAGGPGDVVRLSSRARMVARANELAAGAPEVREEKVGELRRRIDAGTYDVSGRQVAEAMLRKSITEV
ncbi:MAG: flagellar biosynthesis anti-sigma factor FlgM [Candidatus Adiutrix sp.]|jgi:negative regulator of flagellin synthesis FlgM|nr:flagellar biosynthesis anti-sigma factor FlgM [Candidatus Adiutrix sp.]